MKIKGLIDEDFVNYKKPSMFISTYTCTFKCDKECGQEVCHNLPLASQPTLEINNEDLVVRYLNNDISEAVVIGGLEGFDDFQDLYNFIVCFRSFCNDDIVIYTGYKENEIQSYVDKLIDLSNIIVKFGRFLYNDTRRFDEVLGVWLASSNQCAKRIC